jgi:pyroglutamyl-peptidase
MSGILITAFEPFGGDSLNPSQEVLRDFPEFLYAKKVIKAVLPVVYNHNFDRLLPLIEKHEPDVILLLGYAKGRSHLCVERIGINICDSPTPDALGNVLSNRPIVKGGVDGLFSTLPLSLLEKRYKELNLPAKLSNTAGAYVCNNLFYKTLHHIKLYNLQTKVGFIHLPALPSQASRENIPSMGHQQMTEILIQTLDAILNPFDIREFGQEVE